MIKPLVKTPELPLEKKNYRPESNVAFISKRAEKAALHSLSKHIEENALYQNTRVLTEATIQQNLCYDDLLQAMEKGQVTIVNLIAAFDLVDNSIMMDLLDKCFNLQESAADWICSYIADRQLCVRVRHLKRKQHQSL